MRICKVCKIDKPLSDYHVAPTYAGGYKPRCKVCAAAYAKEYRKTITPLQRREAWVKHKYGLSVNEQNDMLRKQGGVCLICLEVPARLCIDHCHTTGKVRGILCSSCNAALGLLKDNINTIDRASAYLKRF